MNLRSFSAIALALVTPAFGDEIGVKMVPLSGNKPKQIRIITQKDPTCDKFPAPTVVAINENDECQDQSADLYEGKSIDHKNKCCTHSNDGLEGYHVWAEKTNKWINWDVNVDFLIEEGVCLKNIYGNTQPSKLPQRQRYNSYMIQNFNSGRSSRRELGRNNRGSSSSDDGFDVDKLMVDFPCQKIVGVMFQAHSLAFTDGTFARGGRSTYEDVRQ
ncbi:MAG: hypothetical protein SGBAC_010694, partial [Bacillariaceae sp.]